MPPPDEDAFRRRREAMLGLPCPFERALLARCSDCSLARPVLMAEREAIGCTHAPANERCHAYHGALRAAARFALRAEPDVPWPFSKEIRLQCGGLLGLREALDTGDDRLDEDGDVIRDDRGGSVDDRSSADDRDSVDAPASIDADALLQHALQRYGSVDALPFSHIMRAVIRHVPRRRAPR